MYPWWPKILLLCLFLTGSFSNSSVYGQTANKSAAIPSCANFTSPSNGAYYPSSGSSVVMPTFTWSDPGAAGASPATSYVLTVDDNYAFASPEISVSNITTTLYYSSTTTLALNSTFYWKITPSNSSGSNSGCSTSGTFYTGIYPGNVSPPNAWFNVNDLATGFTSIPNKGTATSLLPNINCTSCPTLSTSYINFSNKQIVFSGSQMVNKTFTGVSGLVTQSITLFTLTNATANGDNNGVVVQLTNDDLGTDTDARCNGRINYEMSNNINRFDFLADGSCTAANNGQVRLTSTPTFKPNMSRYIAYKPTVSVSCVSTLAQEGVLSASPSVYYNSKTFGSSASYNTSNIQNKFTLGNSNSNTNVYFTGKLSEVLMYARTLSYAEYRKVETYLGIKNGLTLGRNGSTSDAYLNSSGTTVYNSNSGFHYDVIGIAKDGPLNQSKSQTANKSSGQTPNDVIIIANESLTSPDPADEGLYVVIGNNGGSNTWDNLKTNGAGTYTYASTRMDYVTNKAWKIQKTGSATNTKVIVQFDVGSLGTLNSGTTFTQGSTTYLVQAPYLMLGTNSAFDDNNTDPTGENLISYTSVSGSTYTYEIPYSLIDQGTASGSSLLSYFKLGLPVTSLPIELISLKAKQVKQGALIEWKTASEKGADYFTLEGKVSTAEFSFVAQVPAHGNSSSVNTYQFIDNTYTPGSTKYYKLSQTDFNGEASVVGHCQVSSLEGADLIFTLFPNPNDGQDNSIVQFGGFAGLDTKVYIHDLSGRQIWAYHNVAGLELNINLPSLPPGQYIVSCFTSESRHALKYTVLN